MTEPQLNQFACEADDFGFVRRVDLQVHDPYCRVEGVFLGLLSCPRIIWFLLVAVSPLVRNRPSRSVDWSVSALQYQSGNAPRGQGVTPSGFQQILTLQARLLGPLPRCRARPLKQLSVARPSFAKALFIASSTSALASMFLTQQESVPAPLVPAPTEALAARRLPAETLTGWCLGWPGRGVPHPARTRR